MAREKNQTSKYEEKKHRIKFQPKNKIISEQYLY